MHIIHICHNPALQHTKSEENIFDFINLMKFSAKFELMYVMKPIDGKKGVIASRKCTHCSSQLSHPGEACLNHHHYLGLLPYSPFT